MADTIIRDALIKLSVVTGDTAAVQSLASDTSRAFKSTEDSVKQVVIEQFKMLELTKQEVLWVKHVEEEYRQLDDIILQMVEHEKQAVAETKNHGKELEENQKKGKGSGGFLDIASISNLKAMIATVFNPVEIAGGFMRYVTDKVKEIKIELEGGEKAQNEGFLTSVGWNFWKAVGMPGMDEMKPNTTERAMNSLRQEEISLRRQIIEVEKERVKEEVDAKTKLQEAYKRQIAVVEDLVKAEQERLKSAEKEFGLMTGREQDQLAAIAKTIAEKGVGGLSDEEVKFARGNTAFRDVIGKFAQENAQTSGFKERIVDPLKLDEYLNKLQAQLKLDVDLENQITVEITDITKIATQLESKLKPLMEDLANRLRSRMHADLQEIGRKIKAREI